MDMCRSIFTFRNFFTNTFYELQTDNMSIKHLGEQYTSIVCIFSFGVASQVMLERMLVATGKPIGSVFSLLSGTLINVTFDPILIFGLFGFPKLGMKGAAIAKLSELKPAHIQQFIQYLQGDVRQKKDGTIDENNPKLSQATIRRKLTVLQSILKQAVKLDIIPTNPANAEKLTLQKIVASKIEIFSKQEAAQMLECLEQEDLQFQVLVQLAIMTGCRCGELVGLKFSDFDYNKNKVTIERSAYKLPGEPIKTKAPKDYEIRTITINHHCIELVQLLKDTKSKQSIELGTAWSDSDWLFTQWNGEIMNPQTPTKQFSKFLAKNGLKHRKFHSLRHTSATLLLYGGVNLKQVQERLGHGDISTTNKYLHCIAEADEAAANVLQDMLITHNKCAEESAEQQAIAKIV